MFTPPCYDHQTKTDCPDRKLGCHDTCEKWKQWETIRNARYKENYIRNTSYPNNHGRQKEYLRGLQRPKVRMRRK